MLNSLKILFIHIESRRKIQFLFLLIFTIFAGLLEVLSIASVVPFIKLVTNENFTSETIYLSSFIKIRDKQEAVIILGLTFSSLYMLNSFSRIFLIYCTARLSKTTTAELSIKIYKSTIYTTYSSHILKNSNSIIASIAQKIHNTFIFLSIISVLIFINPQVMITSMSFFIIFYFLIAFFSGKSLKKSSYIINQEQNNMVDTLQNSLGGIRDIILNKTQKFYSKIFEKASFALAKKAAFIQIMQGAPRYLLEGLGIFLFVILLIFWSETKTQQEFLFIFPTLAALAIGAQRILPLLNNMNAQYIIIKGSQDQIEEVTNIMSEYLAFENENKKIEQKNIIFENLISFKDISFAYEKKEYILENVNLEIKKGSKIGILGKTGEGKSTFLDLLMGLLEPAKGNIYIDNVKLSKETNNSWQSKISHVPQKIFLSNNSFLENIAFGKEIQKIDVERVESASKKAQIHDFIINSEQKYSQNVGEKGAKLSGGQIQRVGLARALYKNAELIIFDEATNSLDSHTEKLVMEELNNLDQNLTIIIVAHRLNTLKNCDMVFEVKDKKVIQIQQD
jgi:ABC-type multidrug transport system fused ATPase/permease subunit